MKKINPILLTIITITFFTSCSNKWHIVNNKNKLNNLTHWKQDRLAKKEAKNNVQKDNVAKFK